MATQGDWRVSNIELDLDADETALPSTQQTLSIGSRHYSEDLRLQRSSRMVAYSPYLAPSSRRMPSHAEYPISSEFDAPTERPWPMSTSPQLFNHGASVPPELPNPGYYTGRATPAPNFDDFVLFDFPEPKSDFQAAGFSDYASTRGSYLQDADRFLSSAYYDTPVTSDHDTLAPNMGSNMNVWADPSPEYTMDARNAVSAQMPSLRYNIKPSLLNLQVTNMLLRNEEEILAPPERKPGASREAKTSDVETSFSTDEDPAAHFEEELPASPLTKEQKTWNRQVAQRFMAAWRAHSNLKSRQHKRTDARLGEWNPAYAGYSLVPLDLPWEMVLDCVFDTRNLRTADILNCGPHSDPLTEAFLIIQEAGLNFATREASMEIRSFAPSTISSLALYQDSIMTPFAPIAKLLDEWAERRQICTTEAVQVMREGESYRRPVMAKDRRCVSDYMGLNFEYDAVNALRKLLAAKGMHGNRQRAAIDRLHYAKEKVNEICKERGSAFLWDRGDLECLYNATSAMGEGDRYMIHGSYGSME
ncbi:hypothetical protein N0V90_011879 [Kalmusia sp. IMI 367209]|nr:hypothetical protein N0V90_011879 [Kalmusia sp. IMI 367209]